MNMFEENNQKFVEVAWYFTQKEMRISAQQRQGLHPREVFLRFLFFVLIWRLILTVFFDWKMDWECSAPKDVNEIDTITGKASILTEEEFKECEQKGEAN